MCDTDASEKGGKKKRQEYFSQFWNGNKWVVSNFAKHLLCRHPIHQKESEMSSSEVKPSSSSKLEVHQTSLPSGDMENVFSDDNLSDASKLLHEENTPLIGLKIEPMSSRLDDVFTSQLNRLQTQLAFHNIQMNNTSHQNEELKSECEIELCGCAKKIQVCQLPNDGNCLFAATVHQHFHIKIGSEDFENQVTQLRKKVVAHIDANIKLYERELLNRIYDMRGKNEKIQNPEEECKKFLQIYLSKENYWGGSETLRAIGELLETNVIIFNERSDVYFANPFDFKHMNIVTFAFRFSGQFDTKRNHFDSIVKLDGDVLEKCALSLMEKHKKACSIKKVTGTISID